MRDPAKGKGRTCECPIFVAANMPPRKRRPSRQRPAGRQALLGIERSAVREEQRVQGAFDGRYRPRVVRSAKQYRRRPKHRKDDEAP